MAISTHLSPGGHRAGRPFAARLALCAFLLSLLPAALAQVTITGSSRQITQNTSAQFDPSISGNIVVYTDLRNGSADIYYFDLANNTEVRVTSSNADEQLDDVSGDTIVYTRFHALTGVGGVYAFTIGGAEVPVAADPLFEQSNPGVGGSIVAWEDYRTGQSDIWAKDLATGTVKQLTSTAVREADPAVDGGRVAYQQVNPDSTCHIFVTEFDTLSTRQLSVQPGCHSNPDISGNIVVYDGVRSGERDIYVFSLATSTETRISLPGLQRNPNVSGDWVAFEDVNSGKSEVKLYHVPTGALFPAAVNAANNYLNAIDGTRVAYTSDANGAGNLDIFVYEFTVFSGITTYRDRADFLRDAGPVSLVNFDKDTCGNSIAAPSPGVLVGTRYAPLGVTFSAGLILDYVALGGVPVSSPNIVFNAPTPALVAGSFVTPVKAVGISNVGAEAVLRIYDTSNSLAASVTTDTGPGADFVGLISTVDIARFEFDFVSGLGFGGDDLYFTQIRSAADQARNLLACMPGFALPKGLENSLSAKLSAAARKLDAAEFNAACNLLGAFLNEVQAQTGRGLTAQQAAQLTELANQMKVVAGCP